MDFQSTDRRTVLLATATVGCSVLTGCIGNAARDATGNGVDSETPASDTSTPTPDRPNPSKLIDEFLNAVRQENRDALGEILHPKSPIHPSNFEGTEWEFEGGSYEPYEYSNVTVVNADASADDIKDFEGIDFWFQDQELDDVLGDTALQVVTVEVESDSSTEQPDKWVLAKETGEWRIFWMGQRDDTPEDPEEVFEEPIDDEDNAVVAEVQWDVDAVDNAGPTPSERFDYAKVQLTESPGIDAERVIIESTVADGQFEFYTTEDSETTTSCAGSWANVQIDPDGDQIVVTAVHNGTEEIVYRAHYQPAEDS